MGYGMTGNLIDKSGCDIYGYDPVPALRERFAARGGKVLDDAKTLYKTCDIIFMCLPTMYDGYIAERGETTVELRVQAAS